MRFLNSILLIFVVFMGLKQGWAMFSGKQEMLEMFCKWHFTKTGVMINGAITILGAILILFPRTFILGNLIMAAGVLMIICFHLLDKDIMGMVIEFPFLILNLVIIYLKYPLSKML